MAEGRTLVDVLRKGPPLSLGEKLQILEGICSELGALHTRGIVHRNLTARNVLLSEAGNAVTIGGLEFAHIPGRPRPEAGALMGVSIMAPETMMGVPAAPASDVFALGALAYELFGGRPAFPGGLETGILHKILNCDVDPLIGSCPDLDPRIAHVVERALSKDPSSRATLGEIVSTIATIRQPSFPRLRLLRALPHVVIEGLAEDGTFILGRVSSRIAMGRAPMNDLLVRGVRLYGRTNCFIDVSDGGSCTIRDGGHLRQIRVNGVDVASKLLMDGDVIEPAAAEDVDRPLAFVFEAGDDL
jgi:serine/threonine protein kinase